MEFIKLTCPNCGGNIGAHDGEKIKCAYCDTVYRVEDLMDHTVCEAEKPKAEKPKESRRARKKRARDKRRADAKRPRNQNKTDKSKNTNKTKTINKTRISKNSKIYSSIEDDTIRRVYIKPNRKKSRIKRQRIAENILMYLKAFLFIYLWGFVLLIIGFTLDFVGDKISEGMDNFFALFKTETTWEEKSYDDTSAKPTKAELEYTKQMEEWQQRLEERKKNFVIEPGRNLSGYYWELEEMRPMEEQFLIMVEALYEKDYFDMTLEDWAALTSLDFHYRYGSYDVDAVINGEKIAVSCEGDVGQVLDFVWAFENMETLDAGIFDLEKDEIHGLVHLKKIHCRNAIGDLVEILENPAGVTELSGVSADKDEELEGVEKLTGLKSLDISIDYCSDISVLGQLKELEVLDLYVDRFLHMKNYDFLGELTKLKKLSLDTEHIYSIEFLSNLKELEELEIYGGGYRSIAVLKELPKLKRVKIWGNDNIEDLEVYDSLVGVDVYDEKAENRKWLEEQERIRKSQE